MRLHREQACMVSLLAHVANWSVTALRPYRRRLSVTFRPLYVGTSTSVKRVGFGGVTLDAKRPRTDVHPGGLGLRVPSSPFVDDVRMLPSILSVRVDLQ